MKDDVTKLAIEGLNLEDGNSKEYQIGKWTLPIKPQGFDVMTVNELFRGSKPIIRPVQALERKFFLAD
jgi:hypothetical protein